MTTSSDTIANIIGFVLTGVFIIFICTRLFRRFRSQPSFDLDATINNGDVNHTQHQQGLEPVLVAEIPTTYFCPDTFSVEDAQCSICLGEYEEKEVLRIMPKCGHTYHLHCIDIWLAKHPTCPVCRLTITLTNRRNTTSIIVDDIDEEELLDSEDSRITNNHQPNHIQLAAAPQQGSTS